MNIVPKAAVQSAGFARMRSLGRQMIGLSFLVLFFAGMSLLQLAPAPRGEIGNFAVEASFYIFPCCLWGLATGFGILRAWRWARISMLVFGALLALFCALPGLLFLGMPGGSADSGMCHRRSARQSTLI